jgi:hypothetical protein
MPGASRPRSTTVTKMPRSLTLATGSVSGSDSNGRITRASIWLMAIRSSMSSACSPALPAVLMTISRFG